MAAQDHIQRENKDELEFLSMNFPTRIEDSKGRKFPSLQHFYQSQKFAPTDFSHAERIRLANTPQEADELGHSRSFQIRKDWEIVRSGCLFYSLRLKFSDPELKEKLLHTDASQISEYLGDDLLSDLVLQLREEYLSDIESSKNPAPRYYSAPKTKNQAKSKFIPSNIYRSLDGSVVFDMVSSDTVRLETPGKDVITIPMSAIPAKAKGVAHQHQFQKKFLVVEDESAILQEDSDDDGGDLDHYGEEERKYLYNRDAEFKKPILEFDESYTDEIAALVSIGFTDESANLSALLTADGDINQAIDLLTTL